MKQATNIKVFVRVRPADPGTGAGCLSVKPPNKIAMINRPNEISDRVVDGVFTGMDQNAVWDDVGRPALDAMFNGQFACITLFGQSKSGKSFSLFGLDDGIVNRVVMSLAENTEANMSILFIHQDSVQDLHNVAAAGLRIKVDDATGTVVEGATTVRIPSTTQGMEHIRKCLANRDALLEKSGLVEGLCWTVYMFAVGNGCLCLVDCPASERVWKAIMTDAEKQELVKKNKILAQFQHNWLEAAVNADPKAIGWKDTKAGRFLQPALSQCMEGSKGYAAKIVCVIDSDAAALETLCSIDYAERCVKQDSLKSVSEYKEIISNLEDRCDPNEREKTQLITEMKAMEAAASRARTENEARLKEIAARKDQLHAQVAQTQQSYDADIQKLKQDYERKKQDCVRSNQEALERLRNLAKNAPMQAEADIKKKVAEVETDFQSRMVTMNKELNQLKAEIKENKELLAELKQMKADRDKEEAIAMKPVREMEKELASLKTKLTTAGPSREDGLTPQEIAAKQTLWDLRDELDDLEEEVQTAALECMAMENALEKGIGKPESSKSSSDASSSSGSNSDETSSNTSSSDESSDDEDAKEKAAKLQLEMEEAKKEDERKRIDQDAYDRELSHFREQLSKDQFLTDLLEKIVLYLEYGTNVTILTAKGFERRFLFLGKNRKNLAYAEEVKEGGHPNKRQPLRIFKLEEVQSIRMGQHSPMFQATLKKVAGRVDPPRNEVPPSPEDLSPNNMHRYYYRSFSLEFQGDEGHLDIVCDTQTDFEAMIVAYYRLTKIEASWGKKLYIEFCEDLDKLENFEKAFCESMHLTPQQFLFAKQKILEDQFRLFITLHDIRVITSLDLFHAQKLLDLFMKQKWVVRRQLNYFKYQEKLLQQSEGPPPPPALEEEAPPPPPTNEMEDVL